MYQRVKRSDLKPGMFVISHGLGTFGSPLVNVGAHILCLSNLCDYVPEDVEDVLIARTQDALLEGATALGAPVTVSLAEELPQARRLYSEALSYVRHFLEDVRKGTSIDFSPATPLVENLIESVFRNENAAVTLCKLRGFDEYTYTHSINVSILAVLLGKRMGLDRAALLKIGLAGLLHDVGKARLPAKILNKPGRLSETEFHAVKGHSMWSHDLLKQQGDMPRDILRAVAEHHERHDGSGYPRGLQGHEISLFSRIIAVADVFDALTSKRAYKDAMPPAQALSMMYQWRGKQFATEDIEFFIQCIGVFPVGSFVRLTDGEHGIVISTNPHRPTKPQVKVVLDAKLRPRLPRVLDLEALEATHEAQDIAEVLNPADYKIDMGRFFSV
ncbi:MAG: HD-GYP domain-containing protein [Humidesulfovibrio sp.]|uniref:HD-GYP domain-containing protein n=1 Tax=Humidesulfovibrio sp. TaxID=2910988 RepID=UPI0027FBAB45|nr:HD-GYP domain-containing protein [Humidesulfovibrio sp.]MDQ7836459.1 HD-GYP domain-containing protein [Humidesulfovibrio sp.]